MRTRRDHDNYPSPGNVFVLVFTFPSLSKYVAGEQNGQLCFIPIENSMNIKGALAWDTRDSIDAWLTDFRKNNGAIKFKALISLKMGVMEMQIKQ